VRQYKAIDHTVTFFSYISGHAGVRARAFLKIMAVQLNKAFGSTVIQYQASTTQGRRFWSETVSRANHLILPTISLALIGIVSTAATSAARCSTSSAAISAHGAGQGAAQRQGDQEHGVRTAVIRS